MEMILDANNDEELEGDCGETFDDIDVSVLIMMNALIISSFLFD